MNRLYRPVGRAVQILERLGIECIREGSEITVRTPYNDSVTLVPWGGVDYVARRDIMRLIRTRRYYIKFTTM